MSAKEEGGDLGSILMDAATGRIPRSSRRCRSRWRGLRFACAVLLGWAAVETVLLPWRGDWTSAQAKPPEERVEDRVDDEVEEEVENEVEQEVENRIENRTEDRIENRTEDRVEDRVQNRVEEDVEHKVEHGVEDELENALEREVEEETADRAERKGERDREGEDLGGRTRDEDGDDAGRTDRDGKTRDRNRSDSHHRDDGKEDRERRRRAATASGRKEHAPARTPATVVTHILDDLGRPEDVIADEVLVLIPTRAEAAFARLTEQGLAVAEDHPLPALGGRLVRLVVPDGRITAARAALARALPEAVAVDYNHLYRPAEAQENGKRPALTPDRPRRAALSSGEPADPQAPAIGLVDGAIARTHPCFHSTRIREKHFLPAGGQAAYRHGTMTASVILADPACGVNGVSPRSPLYLATVFMRLPEWGPVTTAESLVAALDWLAASPARIVVLALAGPPNALLEAAVARAAERGLLLFAAAGNDGPHAPPRYPAAYPAVFAVTAVDRRGRVYVHAVRGPHIAFAAPGVDVPVAIPAGGLTRASGTSFAAAFAGAAAARLLAQATPDGSASREAILSRLLTHVADLPPAGRDPLTGYGLIRAGFAYRSRPR